MTETVIIITGEQGQFETCEVTYIASVISGL